MCHFVCPVCQLPLQPLANSLKCPSGHCYDRARRGYVNLLMSQKVGQKRHGDDKLMALARANFLSKGYYKPLLDLLFKSLLPLVKTGDVVLDGGCGEGWYTQGLYQGFVAEQVVPHMLGIDISRDTLDLAARREPRLELAVASAFKLPVAGGSCNMVLSIFAPYSADEVRRVLTVGGVFVQVFPLERHLMELKQAVYDSAYENQVQQELPQGFALLGQHRLEYNLELKCHEDIKSLFQMTPYYYKTSVADQQKLLELKTLKSQIAFGIRLLERSAGT